MNRDIRGCIIRYSTCKYEVENPAESLMIHEVPEKPLAKIEDLFNFDGRDCA